MLPDAQTSASQNTNRYIRIFLTGVSAVLLPRLVGALGLQPKLAANFAGLFLACTVCYLFPNRGNLAFTKWLVFSVIASGLGAALLKLLS